jgi:acetoacetyl-CoA synthetase
VNAPLDRSELRVYDPSAAEISASEMSAFMKHCAAVVGHSFDDAEAFHRFSIDEGERFWALLLEWLALDIQGERTPALRGTTCEKARFFPNVKLSFAKNLLRSATPDDDDRVAIIAIDETGTRREWSRGELTGEVLAIASALSRAGVGSHDRVVAVAPNTLESVAACLATLAVGASWSSVAPNLGLDATLDRFVQLGPKVLFTVSSYRYQGLTHDVSDRIADLVTQLPTLELVVALDGKEVKGHGPAGATKSVVAMAAFARERTAGPFRSLGDLPVFPFDHPVYVLFSSGTTGRPKCIVHGAGGTLLEHAKEHRLHSNLRPGEKLFFQTAAGWMMWNWLVSALASRVAIVLYEGSPTFPTPEALWRMVARERVHVFGTSPGFLQYSREGGLEPCEFDFVALRAIQSTGSVLPDDLFRWTIEHVKRVPIQSISGGTDIIGCFLLGNPNRPVFAGELQSKSLGYDVDAFGPDGKPARPGSIGELVCKRPFPSRPVGLFGDANGERFHAAYFAQNAGVWTHGDLVEFTASGGARIHGRSDGVLNIRGIRIGPAEIYRALSAGVPEVVEAMAVEQAAPQEIGGSRLVLLVMLREGANLSAKLEEDIRRELSSRCSAAHVPAVILARKDLPTTHSGKRSERAARDSVNRRPVANIGALRNPDSLAGLDTAPELALEAPLAPRAGPSHDISIDDLCAIWRDVLAIPHVGRDDAFFNLGGHSLAAVSLLAKVERAFGVRLPMSSLLARASTPARMAAILGGEAERQDTHIVAIRTEGKKVPVFWLPGGGGLSVLAFRQVSMRLGEDQPVFGFEAKLTLDDAPASIAEIAHRYVDDLIKAFPDGPYLLFGFSFGSWVAFEMGVELNRRGKTVPLLCVFDSPIPVKRTPIERGTILAQRAGYHAKNLVKLPAKRVPGYMKDAAEVASRRAREQLARLGLNVDPRYTSEGSGDTVFDTLDRRNRAAAAEYVKGDLPTFDGRITVILAERTSQAAVSPELDDRLTIGRYATQGLEVHRVPGAHLTMLEPPEVDGLAAVLRDCIERATEGESVTTVEESGLRESAAASRQASARMTEA